jgi:flavin reductase (DIM6/NTAB) family NADH-FMN oxidoreductase RutF
MKSFPLNKAFTFLEPGPVILVSTADGDKPNIMTRSWTMVLDFTPRFAFMTGPWNYSYMALSKTGEWVSALPTAGMAQTVVSIGSCSRAEVNKFEKFKLTPVEAKVVKAPLIKECYTNLECRVADDIKKHGIFSSWTPSRPGLTEPTRRNVFPRRRGGWFIVDGEKINHRKIMRDKLPEGM